MPVDPRLQTALGGLRSQIGARRRMLPPNGGVGGGGAGGPGAGGVGGTAGPYAPESPPWANLSPPPQGVDLRALSNDPFGGNKPMQFDQLPAQLGDLQFQPARGGGGNKEVTRHPGAGVSARPPVGLSTTFDNAGPALGGGVAAPTGGVGVANPFMQDGVPQTPAGLGGPLTLDAMPGSGPIMDPAQQQQQQQLQTAMQGFQGRGGNTQQLGPGRFGGAPPPDVLARRRALMQRMSGLAGGAAAGGFARK